MIRVEHGNAVYFWPQSHAGEEGFVWAAFSRLGGVSQGAFASLNVGYHVGDDSDCVSANRQRLASALSIPLDHLVAAQQVHGDRVAVVDESNRGRGTLSWDDALPQTDAMITQARQTFLMITLADCAALTFHDPVQRVVGIAHCGWRGMLAGLGQKTVETMKRSFNCDPQDLELIVSPSIGPCCYEVGELVLMPLKQAYPSWRSFIRESDGKIHLDLWEMARWQSLESGLQPANIHIAGLCTACQTNIFYSHRAERGNTGRFAVVAGMR